MDFGDYARHGGRCRGGGPGLMWGHGGGGETSRGVTYIDR